jgi:hypothetical protein
MMVEGVLETDEEAADGPTDGVLATGGEEGVVGGGDGDGDDDENSVVKTLVRLERFESDSLREPRISDCGRSLVSRFKLPSFLSFLSFLSFRSLPLFAFGELLAVVTGSPFSSFSNNSVVEGAVNE